MFSTARAAGVWGADMLLVGLRLAGPPLRCPLGCGFWGDLPCAFGASSSEGSIHAVGVLAEQPGMCYGKRDLLKPTAPCGVCGEGFQLGWEEPCEAARGSSLSPMGPIALVPAAATHLPWDCCSCCISHTALWTVRGVRHLTRGQALYLPRSNQLDFLRLPGSEERCCCQALGCAHPLLESIPSWGEAGRGSHLGCSGITASGLSVALIARQACGDVPGSQGL